MAAPAHYLAERAREQGAALGYNRAVQDIGDRVRGYAYSLIERGDEIGREFLALADVIQGDYPALPIKRTTVYRKGKSIRWIEERGSTENKEFREVHNGNPLEWQKPLKWYCIEDDTRAVEKRWREAEYKASWEK